MLMTRLVNSPGFDRRETLKAWEVGILDDLRNGLDVVVVPIRCGMPLPGNIPPQFPYGIPSCYPCPINPAVKRQGVC